MKNKKSIISTHNLMDTNFGKTHKIKEVYLDELDIIKAYQKLIDDYSNRKEVIKEKLKDINDLNKKIEYLKKEDIEYLKHVGNNPELMLASGFTQTTFEHKAGLDRWIELEIREIELQLNNKPELSHKNYKTFEWQSSDDIDKELETLMHELILGQFIKLMAIEDFKKIFKGYQIDDNIQPIIWYKSNRLLAYFLNNRFNHVNWQSIAGNGLLFKNKTFKTLTSNDLSVAFSNLKFGNPIGYKRIDKIIKEIKETKKH